MIFLVEIHLVTLFVQHVLLPKCSDWADKMTVLTNDKSKNDLLRNMIIQWLADKMTNWQIDMSTKWSCEIWPVDKIIQKMID